MSIVVPFLPLGLSPSLAPASLSVMVLWVVAVVALLLAATLPRVRAALDFLRAHVPALPTALPFYAANARSTAVHPPAPLRGRGTGRYFMGVRRARSLGAVLPRFHPPASPPPPLPATPGAIPLVDLSEANSGHVRRGSEPHAHHPRVQQPDAHPPMAMRDLSGSWSSFSSISSPSVNSSTALLLHSSASAPPTRATSPVPAPAPAHPAVHAHGAPLIDYDYELVDVSIPPSPSAWAVAHPQSSRAPVAPKPMPTPAPRTPTPTPATNATNRTPSPPPIPAHDHAAPASPTVAMNSSDPVAVARTYCPSPSPRQLPSPPQSPPFPARRVPPPPLIDADTDESEEVTPVADASERQDVHSHSLVVLAEELPSARASTIDVLVESMHAATPLPAPRGLVAVPRTPGAVESGPPSALADIPDEDLSAPAIDAIMGRIHALEPVPRHDAPQAAADEESPGFVLVDIPDEELSGARVVDEAVEAMPGLAGAPAPAYDAPPDGEADIWPDEDPPPPALEDIPDELPSARAIDFIVGGMHAFDAALVPAYTPAPEMSEDVAASAFADNSYLDEEALPSRSPADAPVEDMYSPAVAPAYEAPPDRSEEVPQFHVVEALVPALVDIPDELPSAQTTDGIVDGPHTPEAAAEPVYTTHSSVTADEAASAPLQEAAREEQGLTDAYDHYDDPDDPDDHMHDRTRVHDYDMNEIPTIPDEAEEEMEDGDGDGDPGDLPLPEMPIPAPMPASFWALPAEEEAGGESRDPEELPLPWMPLPFEADAVEAEEAGPQEMFLSVLPADDTDNTVTVEEREDTVLLYPTPVLPIDTAAVPAPHLHPAPALHLDTATLAPVSERDVVSAVTATTEEEREDTALLPDPSGALATAANTDVTESDGETEVDLGVPRVRWRKLAQAQAREEKTVVPGAFPQVVPDTTVADGATTSTAVEKATPGPGARSSPMAAAFARRRSPLDAALAMQLRPGFGVGSDGAWLVRFLMSFFGWLAVLISGGQEPVR